MAQPSQIYAELQQAFDHFNRLIFAGKLPNSMITLQRERHTFGYFSRHRFVENESGELVDEIAMNPSYFAVRTIKQTLSTLVHEMVHQWQEYHGSPGRRRYHNKEWADKMEEIGLMPSDTGRPGGKRTGDCMSHYIIEGGVFDRACDKLITTTYRISWFDRFPARLAAPPPAELPPGGQEDIDFSSPELPVNPGFLVMPPDEQQNKSNRVKYRCPSCCAQVWGKPNLRLLCGEPECKAAALLPESSSEGG